MQRVFLRVSNLPPGVQRELIYLPGGRNIVEALFRDDLPEDKDRVSPFVPTVYKD